jgi:hypothetical protein
MMYASLQHGASHPLVKVMSFAEYTSRDHKDLLQILRHQHLVVVEQPVQKRAFNAAGLSRLGTENKRTVIHGKLLMHKSMRSTHHFLDHSIPYDPRNPNNRQREGTLSDFAAAVSGDDGRILNGLDFPFTIADSDPWPLSSDLVAWRQTQGLPFCVKGDHYPYDSMRWGLCATAGAYSRSHMDANGGCTKVSPESGVKIWLLGLPPSCNFDELADIDTFTAEYDPYTSNAKKLVWYPLVLKPGTTL